MTLMPPASMELVASVARTGTYRIWQAIRARRSFQVSDLEELNICQSSTIRRYCQRLAAVGILRRDGRRPVTFQLVRDLGPLAPVVSVDGGIRDPNVDPTRPYDYTDPRSEAAAILDTLLRLPCWTCSINRDPARQCSACAYSGEDRERFIAAAERAARCVRKIQRPRGNWKGAQHV